MSAPEQTPDEQALLASPEEDYMSPRQLAFFRRLLQMQRAELLQAEEDTGRNLKEIHNTPDPMDRAAREEALTLELRLRDRERRLLAKVESALARIDLGSYGWCEDTGEHIGLARLLSRPTATLCLEAQRRRERRQEIHGE